MLVNEWLTGKLASGQKNFEPEELVERGVTSLLATDYVESCATSGDSQSCESVLECLDDIKRNPCAMFPLPSASDIREMMCLGV